MVSETSVPSTYPSTPLAAATHVTCVCVFILSRLDAFLPCRNSDVKNTKGNRCSYQRLLPTQQRIQSTRELGEQRSFTVNRRSAMARASGRLVRATTSSYHIPSLKFPFHWEAKKPPHRINRCAEQRAALITLGGDASITPEKTQGVFLSESEVKSVDLLSPLAYEIARRMILRQIGAAQLALARQCWSKIVERMIHQVIISCQSFTLFGVAGSLVGSVPLFVEGCAVVVKSFFMRFHGMSHTVDLGETTRLLIEALDMFLIGTALLTFGMGLYTMFHGSQSIQEQEWHRSHLGAFDLKKLKEGARIRCVTQAKARIGHAILLLLQVGVLEKFMNVPLVTGLDMACCGGSLLATSAGVFLLSKLNRTSGD